MRLRSVRVDHGLTIRQLAARVGVGELAVIRWESGKAIPRLGNIVKIAEALQVKPQEIDELAAGIRRAKGE